ncbi:MAG: chitobiase/beta-hexosaminidase C-terminal domain-containing protein [Steroidobacteraceae bacterium]
MKAPGRRTSIGLVMVLFACAAPLHAQLNVTTYHNDNARTGQNTQETTLTPANVNSTQFGKLFTVTVDGLVYAQPLYLSNVTISGAARNVLYVATEHDSVYAVDADTGRLYWQKSLLPAGGSPVSSGTDLSCGDVATEVGITGTPVIDAANGTLFVVAKVKVGGVISQYLHALDVSTAAEKFGGPVLIQASVSGTGTGGDGSVVTFNSKMENQRAALLLTNGHVVISWAAHCDNPPWHGWLMSYGATNLVLEGVYNPSSDGGANGIWMSGSGPAADAGGNIYVATGNGNWNGTSNLGDSVIKLGPPVNGQFPVIDYFTPFNQATLSSDDEDLSAGGLILLPALPSGQQLLTLIGKEGKLYLVDRSNMGKYCGTQPGCTTSDPNIVQEIPNAFTGMWGVPAYWNGNLYWGGGNDDTGVAEAIKAFGFNVNNSGLISTTPTSSTAKAFNFSGPVPSVSSNGVSDGIVWGLDNGAIGSTCSNGVNCQVLYAYDATDLGRLLYNSGQAANHRDVPGGAVTFTTPTVINGKVYVGSVRAISAFGLLGSAPPVATAPTFSPPSGTYPTTQSVSLTDTTPGAVIYFMTDGTTPSSVSNVYASPIQINTATIIKAVASATGYANSAVASATYTIASAGQAPVGVNLSGAFNVNAIGSDGVPVANGGMDTLGYAYSGDLLGQSVAWSGAIFTMGAAGGTSGVWRVTISLPAGNYSTLNLLGTGVRGNQVNQSFIVTYTDGTTTRIQQSLSDWAHPQNYNGESKALSMAYRLSSKGAINTGPFYLYGYAFSIDSTKTVKSLTLPANRNVVVLAAALKPVAPTQPSNETAVNLSASYNVHGIASNGTAVAAGGLDGVGYAYSGNLLGTSKTWSGTTFTLGNPNIADAVSTATVQLPAGSFSTLKVLATAVRGNQANQTFTVTYTDGTSTVVQQSLSDWATPQNYNGESKAVTMAYRVTSTGSTSAGTFYLYGYSLAIDHTKTVKSVTVPGNRRVVVLAATLLP